MLVNFFLLTMTNIDPARSATTAAQTPTVFVPVLGEVLVLLL